MRRRSRRPRSVVCLPFSWGAFFVPGSWLRSFFSRPSGNFSTFLTRNLLVPWWTMQRRRSTTSTTRTTVLCCVASSMSLAEPFCTSKTNSRKLFAWPLPKWPVTMLCSSSILRISSTEESPLYSSPPAGRALLASQKLLSLALLCGHHSNLDVFSAPLSATSKLAPTSCLYVILGADLACCWLASSRRSTSSRRRSRTPAFAPVSFTSGLKSSSIMDSASCPDLMAARNWCFSAPSAVKRFASSRSSMRLMNSSPSGGHLLGSEIFLDLTSSSPLNGKRPVTRPNITTPMAQMSTFSPYASLKNSGDQYVFVPHLLLSLSLGPMSHTVPKSLRYTRMSVLSMVFLSMR
mmetsp:Transcript_45709/g.135336  ORF Transcript_45709/g.135336 Transcript_45709/m.135336 type:complete len:348 (-) Transcript_45709:607-1650(-)